MTALTKLSTDYTSSDQAKELVDRLLSNLFPFKSYNPSDETQSPLPVYCNPETRMNAVDLLEAMVYQNPKLFPQIAVVLRQNHPVLPGNITNKLILLMARLYQGLVHGLKFYAYVLCTYA